MSWLSFCLLFVDVTSLVDAFKDDKTQSVTSEIKATGDLSHIYFFVSSALIKLASSGSFKTLMLMVFCSIFFLPLDFLIVGFHN